MYQVWHNDPHTSHLVLRQELSEVFLAWLLQDRQVAPGQTTPQSTQAGALDCQVPVPINRGTLIVKQGQTANLFLFL